MSQSKLGMLYIKGFANNTNTPGGPQGRVQLPLVTHHGTVIHISWCYVEVAARMMEQAPRDRQILCKLICMNIIIT